MVAITQRDLPYIVLTYDPNLQAYRTDTIDNVSLGLPGRRTGDIICEQVGYEPLLTIDAGRRQRLGRGRRRVGRARGRRRDRLRLRRLDARRRAAPPARARAAGAAGVDVMSARWLAGKVAAALLTLVFVLVFNFFLFRVMGDPTTQLARLPQASTPRRSSS